jgi:hypothetical protein
MQLRPHLLALLIILCSASIQHRIHLGRLGRGRLRVLASLRHRLARRLSLRICFIEQRLRRGRIHRRSVYDDRSAGTGPCCGRRRDEHYAHGPQCTDLQVLWCHLIGQMQSSGTALLGGARHRTLQSGDDGRAIGLDIDGHRAGLGHHESEAGGFGTADVKLLGPGGQLQRRRTR